MNKTAEVAVGLFLALGLAALLFLAVQVSGLAGWGTGEGYRVSARFENIGGLKVRAPVAMAGVRIGRVSAVELDTNTFQALVTMTLQPQYQLPLDTSASILTAGLLGEQYIGLQAGAEEDALADGDVIEITQSALVLERLVGQFFSNAIEN